MENSSEGMFRPPGIFMFFRVEYSEQLSSFEGLPLTPYTHSNSAGEESFVIVAS
jgi:hypothetical protein